MANKIFIPPVPVVRKKRTLGRKRGKLIADILTYLLVLYATFLMIYPFWWMIAASFDSVNSDITSSLTWFPSKNASSWAVYRNFFAEYIRFFCVGSEITSGPVAGVSVWQVIGNTLIYSVIPAVVGTLISAAAAYSFSKIRWAGREVVYKILLFSVLIPTPSVMVVQYCLFDSLGWLKTETSWLAMVLPGLFGSVVAMFFIRQYLLKMPDSVIESAKIDGAGNIRIFFSLVVPSAMPVIAVQAILAFLLRWNDFMSCWIFVGADPTRWNLSVLLWQISEAAESGEMHLGALFAGCAVAVVPIFALFCLFRKKIFGILHSHAFGD